jgi:hypothetical protein
MIETLISKIQAHCQAAGMAETTFGRVAVNDGKFVGRLRAGKQITLATLERVEAYLAKNSTEAAQAPSPHSQAVSQISA